MKTSNQNVRDWIIPTAATVIGGLILSGIAALSGFLLTIWLAITVAAGSIWKILSFSASIPISLLITGAIFTIWLTNSLSFQDNNPSQYELNTQNVTVNESEERIIRYLAKKDREWTYLEEISSRLSISGLRAEQVLEHLLRKDLIIHSSNYLHGQCFRLSPKGRDFAIDRGYT